jgi:hypothetical protein
VNSAPPLANSRDHRREWLCPAHVAMYRLLHRTRPTGERFMSGSIEHGGAFNRIFAGTGSCTMTVARFFARVSAVYKSRLCAAGESSGFGKTASIAAGLDRPGASAACDLSWHSSEEGMR